MDTKYPENGVHAIPVGPICALGNRTITAGPVVIEEAKHLERAREAEENVSIVVTNVEKVARFNKYSLNFLRHFRPEKLGSLIVNGPSSWNVKTTSDGPPSDRLYDVYKIYSIDSRNKFYYPLLRPVRLIHGIKRGVL